MRRPRVHKAFGLNPERGLSNVMVGQATSDEVIVKTAFEGLDLYPCGPIPPNPSELFHTAKFKEVLKDLTERYDRVIIDSPPVIAVSDSMVLAQHCDGVLIVARAGSTRKELLKRTNQLLAGINAPVLGVVLNGVNLSSRQYGRYYYYYRHYGQYYEETSELP